MAISRSVYCHYFFHRDLISAYADLAEDLVVEDSLTNPSRTAQVARRRLNRSSNGFPSQIINAVRKTAIQNNSSTRGTASGRINKAISAIRAQRLRHHVTTARAAHKLVHTSSIAITHSRI